LRDTLIDVFARRASGAVAPFDRVIVETSGLANPAPLVASLLGDSALTPRCHLAQVLTLVDAAHGQDTLARHSEAQRQVAFADRLLVSKTDTASREQIEALEEELASLNAQAAIGHWQRGGDAAALFTQAGESTAHAVPAAAWMRGPLGAHGGSFGRISTHVIAMPQRVDWASYARITQALSAQLGKRLLRCKGLLALGDADAPWVVQGVQGYFAAPERLAAWPASAPQGFLVFIGESITRAQLEALVAGERAPSLP
jgi:G3E family GTPase